MILAIDIGGTFIKFGLVDDDFRFSNQSKVPTPPNVRRLWLTLEHIVSSPRISFLGLPLRCPEKVIVNGFIFKGGLIPYLAAIPLGSRLTKTFQLPVKGY